MKASSFRLQKIIFEVRYDNGYLYFDRCGSVWKLLAETYPELRGIHVSPDQAQFRLGDLPVVLHMDQGKAVTHSEYPKSRKDSYEITNKFIPLVAEQLELSAYTRIGCRVMFECMCQTQEGVQEIRRVGLIPASLPSLKQAWQLKNLDLSFTTEESGAGSLVHIATFERKLEFQGLPYLVSVDDSKVSGTGLLVDVDRYVTNAVAVEQLIPSEFTERTYSEVTELLERFFG